MTTYISPARILYFKDRIDKILKGEIPDPVMVEFFLTNACNHRCHGCLFDRYRDNKFIETETLLSVLKEIRGRVISIEFCGGGEPTLHPDFLKIVKTSNDMGFKLGLITNGSMLLKYYKEIVRLFSYVRVSLDASRREIHQKIHGSNDFDNIIEGIKLLASEKKECCSNVEIGLKLLVCDENMDDLTGFVELGKSLRVNSVQIKAIRGTKLERKNNTSIELTIENLKNTHGRNFVIGGIIKTKLKTELCIANLLSCFIIPDGRIMICCYYQGRDKNHCIGKIKDGFWKSWNSNEHAEKILNIDKNMCNTYDCRYHKYNDIIYEVLEKGIHFV